MTSPGMSCKLQYFFLLFLKVSWIDRMFKITLLKMDKSRNVLEASKYFSMIFKSLLDCQKVQNNFSEVWQVLECLGSFKIFFYDFQKTPGSLEGPRWTYWILTCPGMSWNLQNIFLLFLKVSWIARRSKIMLGSCRLVFERSNF